MFSGVAQSHLCVFLESKTSILPLILSMFLFQNVCRQLLIAFSLLLSLTTVLLHLSVTFSILLSCCLSNDAQLLRESEEFLSGFKMLFTKRKEMERKYAHFLVLFLLCFEVLAIFACLEWSPASAYIHFLFSCSYFLE